MSKRPDRDVRVMARAQLILTEKPDATVEQAVALALLEDVFVYGTDGPEPRGILKGLSND